MRRSLGSLSQLVLLSLTREAAPRKSRSRFQPFVIHKEIAGPDADLGHQGRGCVESMVEIESVEDHLMQELNSTKINLYRNQLNTLDIAVLTSLCKAVICCRLTVVRWLQSSGSRSYVEGKEEGRGERDNPVRVVRLPSLYRIISQPSNGTAYHPLAPQSTQGMEFTTNSLIGIASR